MVLCWARWYLMDVVMGLLIMAMYVCTGIIIMGIMYVLADWYVRTMQYIHAHDAYRTRTHHRGIR